ncbi:hypothetical protein [Parenemella sanctibonifatiensis]|uniref:Uncharacterized protein n=1 Tax=Parenemella sanctibonifatiensis TaxID=2016505 RepID=A0A255EN34_9ACTN|nr:hypothetical protein [Parenemella sanctibonifatiensis]OYN89533.1 hypothetical protein CGZ91_11655 [Parenemella sanctibonifatiensis]
MRMRRRTLLAGLATAPAATLGGISGGTAHAQTIDDRERFDSAYAASPPRDDLNNETGGLAWGTSYLMNALVRMYEATCDPSYVQELARVGRNVLAQRDSDRGVTDYLGRSGPVWRTAGNYTAAVAEIPDAAGMPTLDVRYSGPRSSEATVDVAVAGDSFSLVLHHPLHDSNTLEGLSLDQASPDFVEDRVHSEAYGAGARWTAVVRGGAAALPEAGAFPFRALYYAFAVHTGQISYPLAAFARLVLTNPALSGHQRTAQEFAAAAREAVAFHDEEWRESGADRGDYVWPVGAPLNFDGTIQPFNQSHGLGQTIAELQRIEPTAEYANKVGRMVRSWRNDRVLLGDAAVWSYWPTYSEVYRGWARGEVESTYTPSYGATTSAEDLSHAAITIEFLRAAQQAGVEATEGDLASLAATYREFVVRDTDHVWGRVDGSAEATASQVSQIGRWLPLAAQGSNLESHIRAVYLSSGSPSRGLNTAYLHWASVDGWTLRCSGRRPVRRPR